MRTKIFSALLFLSTYSFGQSPCDSLDVQFGSTLSIINCSSIVDFKDSTAIASTDSVISRLWVFDDGKRNSLLQNPSREYTSSGLFDVSLTIQTNEGCSKSKTKTISISGPQPKFGFRDWAIERNDTAYICQGDEIEIINFSSGNSPSPTFEMIWGDGQSGYVGNIGDILRHTYAEPGTYELYLIMEDEVPSTGTRCSKIFPDTSNSLINKRKIVVIVHPKPSASMTVGTSPTYVGHPTSFTANLDPNYTRIKWMMGDGTTYTEPDANKNSIIHKFQSIGTYDVILAPEYDELPRCWARDTFTIQVLDKSLNSIVESRIDLEIFPNPASDVIYIVSKEGETVHNIELTDILGKSCTPTTSKFGSKTTIDVSGLATGNYVLKVATNKGTTTKKIQIERE